MRPLVLVLTVLLLILAGCEELELLDETSTDTTSANVPVGDTYTVKSIIDGDTIDVTKDGVTYRVRYVGVNTPERDESCYQDAKNRNSALVSGKQVTLVKDTSDTDQYGRLLRYVYVGNTFVNETLVREGWAESVRYDPDDQYFNQFSALETSANNAGSGCHPTGIFDDGSNRR